MASDATSQRRPFTPNPIPVCVAITRAPSWLVARPSSQWHHTGPKPLTIWSRTWDTRMRIIKVWSEALITFHTLYGCRVQSMLRWWRHKDLDKWNFRPGKPDAMWHLVFVSLCHHGHVVRSHQDDQLNRYASSSFAFHFNLFQKPPHSPAWYACPFYRAWCATCGVKRAKTIT